MDRLVVTAVLSGALAACSGSGGETKIGGPCGKNNECDDGQICDLTNPAGPAICIDANGDDDHDGIPNGKDFCEHQAGGAFDEDGDGIGDDCDRCPIAKPVVPSRDTDGDMVDFPCDPNPTTPGEQIVLFNGFNAAFPATGAGAWTATAGWTVVGGEAIATPSGPGAIETLTIPIPQSPQAPHTVIFASYRVDQVDPSGDAEIDVVGAVNLPMLTAPISKCGSVRGGGSDSLVVQSDNGEGTHPFTNLFDPASLYKVTEQFEGADANCAIIADRENGAATITTNGTAPNEVHLTVTGATVRFQYILVVQRN